MLAEEEFAMLNKLYVEVAQFGDSLQGVVQTDTRSIPGRSVMGEFSAKTKQTSFIWRINDSKEYSNRIHTESQYTIILIIISVL